MNKRLSSNTLTIGKFVNKHGILQQGANTMTNTTPPRNGYTMYTLEPSETR